MGDLHAEITAKLDELEHFNRELEQLWPTPWSVSREPGAEWVVRPALSAVEEDVLADRLDKATAEHIAAWDPATVLRGLAEDRDILRRHFANYLDDLDMVVCDQCGWDVGDLPGEPATERGGYQPCPDVASLARRHGVEVPHAG